MDIQVNYAGITRRIIAGIIDHVIILGILPTLCFLLIAVFAVGFENNELGKDSLEMALDFFESNELLFIFIISASFIILETLMIIRFSGTPGQLLCGIRIRDATTLKNVTIIQAVIRCVSRDIFTEIIRFLAGYIVLLIAVALAIIFAIFDKRKQFFHDKIARTVVIDYQSLS